MPDLSDFRDKSFVEQISLLDQIETAKDPASIPALVDLFQTPLGDDAVDQTVSDTLRVLLGMSEDALLEGLQSTHAKTVKLCAHIAGSKQITAAGSQLVTLAETTEDTQLLMETLSALAKIGAADHLAVFRHHLDHADPLVTAQCIETLGECRDDAVREKLYAVIDEAESDERFENCDLITSSAIDAVAGLGDDDAVAFLVAKIHHRNPTARRLIIESLVRAGGVALPFIAPLFDQDDVDAKIMAANVLGMIGERGGGDAMVFALDKGQAEDLNVRYAIYEALGNIPFLKGLICLLDGLNEENEMLLMAVVTSLEAQVNPGLIGKVRDILAAGDEQGQRVLRAIAMAKATTLFQFLYEDAAIATSLIDAIAATRDEETLAVFKEKLGEVGGERAAADVQQLDGIAVTTGQTRLLAADDSKSMLMFYKAVAASLEFQIETAVNGREALDRIENGETFDLVITDLNMPVMDGIQLTEQIRANLFSSAVPILMVTTESEGSQVDLAKKAGVSDFIQKPLTPAALGGKIETMLA